MFQNKRFLGLIPARGGSKGIPRKNIKQIGGKPLIAYTIEAAHASRYLDRVVLSSEDDEIIAVARSFKCDVPFVRPKQLADDVTSNFSIVLHTLEELPDYDYLVLLQPTSPLRTAADIDDCIEHCINQGANSCVSVTESSKSPYWMYYLDSTNKMRPVLPDAPAGERQALPTAFVLNGAIYVAGAEWLKGKTSFLSPETVAFVMPRERSVDIDSELDLSFMEACLNTTQNRKL
jgi:N-acylneuraminate cytidylyltransferase